MARADRVDRTASLDGEVWSVVLAVALLVLLYVALVYKLIAFDVNF